MTANLQDEPLDSITKRTEHPNVQVRLLEKLLNDEIKGRTRSNQMQAKMFSEEVRAVLQRYELKQLTSAEVVERLVEIAKQLRDARRRHEQLGLSEEEAAFYDALAGGVEDVKADPELAKIAHELVDGIRTDLTVDWADREATEAKIRAKIKRLLRKHKYRPPTPKPNGGGGGGTSEASTTRPSSSSTKQRRYTATGPMSRSATDCLPDRAAQKTIVTRMDANSEIFKRILDDDEFRELLGDYYVKKVYEQLREAA